MAASSSAPDISSADVKEAIEKFGALFINSEFFETGGSEPDAWRRIKNSAEALPNLYRVALFQRCVRALKERNAALQKESMPCEETKECADLPYLKKVLKYCGYAMGMFGAIYLTTNLINGKVSRRKLINSLFKPGTQLPKYLHALTDVDERNILENFTENCIHHVVFVVLKDHVPQSSDSPSESKSSQSSSKSATGSITETSSGSKIPSTTQSSTHSSVLETRTEVSTSGLRYESASSSLTVTESSSTKSKFASKGEQKADSSAAPEDAARTAHQEVQDPNAMLIVIRGTLSFDDAYADIDGQLVEHEVDGRPWRFQKSVFLAAKNTASKLLSSDKVIEYLIPGDVRTIVITGHSLGGGVAAVLAILLREEPTFQGINIECYAFGEIPSVEIGAKNGNEKFKDSITSIVFGDDIIPRFSFASAALLFHQMRRLSHEKSPGFTSAAYSYLKAANSHEIPDHLHFEIELQKRDDEFKALYKKLKGIGDNARSETNSPASPPSQVNSPLPSSDSASDPNESGKEPRRSGYGNLQLVGKVLHLTETSDKEHPFCAKFVQPSQIDGIIPKIPDMIMDHRTESYIEALTNICRDLEIQQNPSEFDTHRAQMRFSFQAMSLDFSDMPSSAKIKRSFARQIEKLAELDEKAKKQFHPTIM